MLKETLSIIYPLYYNVIQLTCIRYNTKYIKINITGNNLRKMRFSNDLNKQGMLNK